MEATESKALKNAEWLAGRISHIRELKTASNQQKHFATLAQLTERTPAQQKQFAALVKAEKLEERAAAARAQTSKLLSSASRVESAKARKDRTRRLIELGGLVVKAGIDTWKPEQLLGMLANAAGANDERKAAWSTRGAEMLAK